MSKQIQKTGGEVAKVNNVIVGLEEISPNIVPVPWYKVVYSNSTNVGESEPGTIYMGDIGKSCKTLNCVILRAKERTVEFENPRTGNMEKKRVIGILGANIDRGLEPFILSISVSSFTNFGFLVKEIKERKATVVWEYPVQISTEKAESSRVENNKIVKNAYYKLNFVLGQEKIKKEDLETLEEKYNQVGGSLDRYDDQEAHAEEVEFKETEFDRAEKKQKMDEIKAKVKAIEEKPKEEFKF